MRVDIDAIDKAELVVHAVLDGWPRKDVVTTRAVTTRVREFFRSRKQLAWHERMFSDKGWEAIICTCLMERGLKRKGDRWE